MSVTQSLLTIWLLYLGVALTPGVNFALIAQTATRHSRSEALLVAAGILTASAIWVSSALLGLAALAERGSAVMNVLRVVAAVYLIILGISKLRSKPTDTEDLGAPPTAVAGWKHYLIGLSTNLGNPKSLLFYTTLFAASLPADSTHLVRLTAGGLIFATAILIHAGLAVVLSVGVVRRLYTNASRRLDRAFGVLFIVFGVRLLGSRQ